jgi:hypothetical protein
MTIFRITDSALEKVEETTFAREKLLERKDLQRRLKASISVLSPGLMVIDEEFGDWEDSSRRIDLLCLDRDAHLVVVELKRTDDGGHMELQAVRYAAMVSSMTFDQLVGAHAHFLGREDRFSPGCGSTKWTRTHSVRFEKSAVMRTSTTRPSTAIFRSCAA